MAGMIRLSVGATRGNILPFSLGAKTSDLQKVEAATTWGKNSMAQNQWGLHSPPATSTAPPPHHSAQVSPQWPPSCPHPQTQPEGESHHHSPQLRVRVLLGPQGPTPSGLIPLCPQQHPLHSPSHSFCSGHMDSVPQTHQTHFHLRAFALPLPHPTISAWYSPSLEFLEMA